MPEERYHGRGMQTPTDLSLHSRENVIEAFCELAGRVNENVFRWSHASDCVCAIGDGRRMLNFQWDRQVFDFIANAVMGAVVKETDIQERVREAVFAERESNIAERDELEAQLAMTKLP